jgi:sulfite reductase (ferredoxin)
MSVTAYKIPVSLHEEIQELESLIQAFKNGTVTEAELKARRVPFGIYEQRKRGTYMVRIRCTAGIITPAQLLRVADLSLRFASGNLHITTRQEMQIHDVLLEDIIGILKSLAETGLSSRGGGGNTVRNITAPWDAGISKSELFDVTPYAVALTSELISRSDSWLLPRKYKIAFSNGDDAFSYAFINDLGLIPVLRGDVKGFKVYVAGGMGRQSQPGNLLHDFVEASEISVVAEAVKRVFSKHGNRKNKHAARLRFLWNSLGKEQFIALYEQERNLILIERPDKLSVEAVINDASVPKNIESLKVESEQYPVWKKRYVSEQKQSGLYSVKIPLLYGNIRAEKIKIVASALQPFGENTIRFTHDQNITLRNITAEYIGNMFKLSQKVSELSGHSSLYGNAIACAGASTCQLGICRSRGALEAIIDRLKMSDINLDLLNDLRIHISGCSNSCGQHVIADLGFYGKAGRKDQHSYPVYTIVGGATSSTEGVKLAEKIGEISARDLPLFVEELLQHYSERKNQIRSFASYLESDGKGFIESILKNRGEIPSFEEDTSYYRDWGDTEIFSLAGKGTGECSAGLFDLIEIDLSKLRQIRESLLNGTVDEEKSGESYHDLLIVSARMLLITRGVEGTSDVDVLEKFRDHFINGNLIDSRFRSLIEKGITAEHKKTFSSLKNEIFDLSNSVESLYKSMDNSMQFGVKGSGPVKNEEKKSSQGDLKIELVKDFRGVACPMNFVKTKIALSQISSGQVLQVILDDGAPIENVPKSVAEEGHTIVSSVKTENHWLVNILKKQ